MIGKDIRKFKANTLKKLSTVFKSVALDVFGKIVFRTPVDTGHARANWQATVGSPADGVVQSAQPPAAIAAAGLDDVIYITNNVEYVEALEHGHSQQAPAGMVKVTVNEFKGIVNDNVLL
jgi:hypothetical protein